MKALPIARLKAATKRSKDLEKSGKVKTGAKHNDYFNFLNACYCSVPKIYGGYCSNNLKIGRAI